MLGEIGNITAILSFLALVVTFIWFGPPKGLEGWVVAVFMSAIPAFALGLLVGIATGTMGVGGSAGKYGSDSVFENSRR